MPETAVPTARFQAPDVRRRQILDAAGRLAIERGLLETSIARVAEAAGIAKGTLYLYFDSRQALVAGLQADLWERMLKRPLALIEDSALSWSERLAGTVEHWIRFEFEHHDLYHQVFHTAATDTEEPWAKTHDVLTTILKGGVAADEFSIDDIDLTADYLLHAYSGPCYHGHHKGSPEDLIRVVQRLFHKTVAAD
jgi:TetR/AcrR family transcriptional repressor of nem operon